MSLAFNYIRGEEEAVSIGSYSEDPNWLMTREGNMRGRRKSKMASRILPDQLGELTFTATEKLPEQPFR